MLYAGGSAAAVLLIAKSPRGEGDILNVLFGNILTVPLPLLWMMVVAFAAVLAVQYLAVKEFLIMAYDPDMARALGISVGLWNTVFYVALGVAVAIAIRGGRCAARFHPAGGARRGGAVHGRKPGSRLYSGDGDRRRRDRDRHRGLVLARLADRADDRRNPRRDLRAQLSLGGDEAGIAQLRLEALQMTSTDMFDAAELLKKEGPELLRAFIRGHRGAVYADLRFEAMFSRSSSATDGEARSAHEGESAGFSVSVRVDERSGASSAGQTGVEVGRLALRPARLLAAIRAGLAEAYERARLGAREKAALIRALDGRSGLARSLRMAPAPRAPVRDEVAAVYQRDPRTLDPDELKRLCREASARVAGLGAEIAFNAVAALSELREELFISSEGALISQGFAFSQGDCYVVAQSGDGHQEIYDTIGQQRGLECLAEGWRERADAESGPGHVRARARE